MTVKDRLQALGITLPPVAVPAAAYVPLVRSGNLVFVLMAPVGCRQRRSGMEPIEMAKRKTSQPIEPHEIRKLLRQAIRDSGKSVYRLHIETETETEKGIDQGQLHRFMDDEDSDMKASSVERLCKVLNLKLVKDDDSAG